MWFCRCGQVKFFAGWSALNPAVVLWQKVGASCDAPGWLSLAAVYPGIGALFWPRRADKKARLMEKPTSSVTAPLING